MHKDNNKLFPFFNPDCSLCFTLGSVELVIANQEYGITTFVKHCSRCKTEYTDSEVLGLNMLEIP